MAGPSAMPGIYIHFSNCREHTAEEAISRPKVVDGIAVPMTLIAKCAHIHCDECGCIKSRTECVYKEPDKTGKFKEAWGGSTSPDGLPNQPYDYEKVEATGPLVVEFKFRWDAYETRDCWIEGVLPTKMASKIIEIVNSPLI